MNKRELTDYALDMCIRTMEAEEDQCDCTGDELEPHDRSVMKMRRRVCLGWRKNKAYGALRTSRGFVENERVSRRGHCGAEADREKEIDSKATERVWCPLRPQLCIEVRERLKETARPSWRLYLVRPYPCSNSLSVSPSRSLSALSFSFSSRPSSTA